MLFSAPWMGRNCIVLEGFEPLGTQGGVALPSGFSDKAMINHGVWFNPDAADLGLNDNPNSSKQSPIAHEKAVSMHGKEQAVKWIKGNLGKLPLLTFYKITSEWNSRSRFSIFDTFFFLFGLLVFFSINPVHSRVILCLVIASTFPVAITYSAGGRFLFSIHPIKLALVAIGVWTLIISYIEVSLDKLKLH